MALKVKLVSEEISEEYGHERILAICETLFNHEHTELMQLDADEVDGLISELRKFQTPTRLESPVE